MKSGSVGASIVGGNANVDRIRVLLVLCVLKKEVGCQYMRAYTHLNGITYLKKYVPVAIIVKGIGVENLELGHVSTSVLILSYQLLLFVLLTALLQTYRAVCIKALIENDNYNPCASTNTFL